MALSRLKAKQVVGRSVDSIWLSVLPLLAESARHSRGELVAQDLYEGVRDSKMQLFIVWEGDEVIFALVTELQQMRQKKICMILAVGGKGAVEIMREFRGSFYLWLKANDVQSLRSFCRPAVSRLLQRIGFKVKCEMLEIDMEGAML